MTDVTPTVARYHRIADDIQHRITAGELLPGSVLPSEVSLAAEFGVARGTVREAVSLLRERGLVATEPGRGSVVQRASVVADPAGELDRVRSLVESRLGRRLGVGESVSDVLGRLLDRSAA